MISTPVCNGDCQFEPVCAVTYPGGAIVGSRAGAPTPSEIPRPCHVSRPRHVERSMRISRTALPHLLHVEAYETYPAGATFGSAYSIVPSGSPIAPEHTYV